MTREFTRRQLPVHPGLVSLGIVLSITVTNLVLRVSGIRTCWSHSNGSAIAQKRRLLTDYQSAVPPVTLPADKKTLLSK